MVIRAYLFYRLVLIYTFSICVDKIAKIRNGLRLRDLKATSYRDIIYIRASYN